MRTGNDDGEKGKRCTIIYFHMYSAVYEHFLHGFISDLKKKKKKKIGKQTQDSDLVFAKTRVQLRREGESIGNEPTPSTANT